MHMAAFVTVAGLQLGHRAAVDGAVTLYCFRCVSSAAVVFIRRPSPVGVSCCQIVLAIVVACMY